MEHTFSIEMKSKKHVRRMSVSDESHDRVLFEGSLGELEELFMVEGAVLEVKGANGVLRIDLSEDELRKMLSHKKEAE
jgi:predicted Rossmann-fold nucleotide-binding protein